MTMMANFHYHKYPVEICHEKMDLVVRKIHKIKFHSPKDQIYCSQDNFLDLVCRLKSIKKILFKSLSKKKNMNLLQVPSMQDFPLYIFHQLDKQFSNPVDDEVHNQNQPILIHLFPYI